MARVRLLEYRNRQISTPRPAVTEDGNVLGNVVHFDDDGVAEVTDEQAEFLVYQFAGAEILPEPETEPAPEVKEAE